MEFVLNNLGNLLTIITFITGGIVFFVKTGARVDTFGERLTTMEAQLKNLVTILVEQGRHDERMNAIETRLDSQGKRLDETIERLNRYLNGNYKR